MLKNVFVGDYKDNFNGKLNFTYRPQIKIHIFYDDEKYDLGSSITYDNKIYAFGPFKTLADCCLFMDKHINNHLTQNN